MSGDLDNYDQIAEEVKSAYDEGAVFGDWVSRTVSEQISGIGYYQGGQITANVPNDIFAPVMGTNLADSLIRSEKHHIIQQIKNAAEEGTVGANTMSEYSHKGFVEGVGDVQNPSLLILPTKEGRPKRIHKQLNRVNTIPYGAEDVDIEFVSSTEFGLNKGICLSKRVDLYQVNVGEMDVPDNLTPVSGGNFSDDDDLVQLIVGDSREPNTHDLLYRTVFSGLQGLSGTSACIIVLPH